MNSDKRQLPGSKIREIADILRDVVRGDAEINESLLQSITELVADERQAISKAGVAIADRASRLVADKSLRDLFRLLLRERQSIAPAKVAYELDGLMNSTEDLEEKDPLLRFAAAYRQITGLVESPHNRKEAAALAKSAGHLDSEALASLDLANEKWQAQAAHYDATGAMRSEVTTAKQQSAYADEVYDNLKRLLPPRRPWALILGAICGAFVLVFFGVAMIVLLAASGKAQAEDTQPANDDEVAETVTNTLDSEKKTISVESAELQQSLAGIDLNKKTIVLLAPGFQGSQAREQATILESIVRQHLKPAEQVHEGAAESKPKAEVATILYHELPISRKFPAAIVVDQPNMLVDLKLRGFLPADYLLIATKQNTIEASQEVTLSMVLYRLPATTGSEKSDATALDTSNSNPASMFVALERVWSSSRRIAFQTVLSKEQATNQVERLRRGMLFYKSNADLLLSARILVGRENASANDFTYSAAALLRASDTTSDLRMAARDILRAAYRRNRLDIEGSRMLIALEGEADQNLLRRNLDGMSDDGKLLHYFQPTGTAEREKILITWVEEVLNN